jgi:hypothetical protein
VPWERLVRGRAGKQMTDWGSGDGIGPQWFMGAYHETQAGLDSPSRTAFRPFLWSEFSS